MNQGIRTRGTLAALAAAALGVYTFAIRPWYQRWGATEEEAKESLPGDDLPGETSSTRAITIAAPAEEVWRWLVQIGQDRAGFYSYTAIENGVFLAGIRNTDRIVPEWQKREQGDFIPATRRDWMGGRFADRAGWKVADIGPGRYLVLENWGSFLIRPIDGNHCRLIVRSHGRRPPLWLLPLHFLVLEPGHFIMERKMMLGIKQRAEALAEHPDETAPAVLPSGASNS